MVLARPSRSPRMPNTTPPSPQPIMKTMVEMPACCATAPGAAEPPIRSRSAGTRARLKSCCAMVSNIQPIAATPTTNH